MKTGGGTRQWDEVEVDRDLPKRAMLSVHNRHNFNTLSYGVPLGKTEKVSLLCSKVHEIKPFVWTTALAKETLTPV